jgi:sporulation protein YlmC with PRC-barrel domain
MQLSCRQIVGLPVETRSGLRLGVVASLEIDAEQQAVARYLVRPALLPRLLARRLVVNAAQVVSLTDEKLVVEDGLVRDPGVAATPVRSA